MLLTKRRLYSPLHDNITPALFFINTILSLDTYGFETNFTEFYVQNAFLGIKRVK
jgi:hypothetical protein